jgi:hypothetical protein
MKKKNHHVMVSKVANKHTHMTKNCACHLGFRNGKNGRRTTMMSATHAIMV